MTIMSVLLGQINLLQWQSDYSNLGILSRQPLFVLVLSDIDIGLLLATLMSQRS